MMLEEREKTGLLYERSGWQVPYLGLATGFAGGSGRDGVLARGFLAAGSGAGFVSLSVLPSAVLLSSVVFVSLNCFFQRGMS